MGTFCAFFLVKKTLKLKPNFFLFSFFSPSNLKLRFFEKLDYSIFKGKKLKNDLELYREEKKSIFFRYEALKAAFENEDDFEDQLLIILFMKG